MNYEDTNFFKKTILSQHSKGKQRSGPPSKLRARGQGPLPPPPPRAWSKAKIMNFKIKKYKIKNYKEDIFPCRKKTNFDHFST